jgi:hypothetical protein
MTNQIETKKSGTKVKHSVVAGLVGDTGIGERGRFKVHTVMPQRACAWAAGGDGIRGLRCCKLYATHYEVGNEECQVPCVLPQVCPTRRIVDNDLNPSQPQQQPKNDIAKTVTKLACAHQPCTIQALGL